MVYYPCSEHKSLSPSEPRRLADCQEARDLLLKTFLKDGFCIAVFKFGAVALPEELEPQLAALVGKQCVILRLENKFYVREV